MGILDEQIDKAQARAAGFDIRRVALDAEGKFPAELATDAQKADRLRFLTENLPTTESALDVLERILGGNEIQDVNYLARGARVAQAVARIAIRDEVGRDRGYGTGFLIAPGVLMTNNHVLASISQAARSAAEFDYELDISGAPSAPVKFDFDPARLFYTSPELDYTVVAVSPRSTEGDVALLRYGFLPLVGVTGKVTDGEWLTVIQHPKGGRKQICVRENKLLKRTKDVLWYSTDTLAGSSGSPVFNNDWYVVALHHSGIPQTKDGKRQTLDGVDYDQNKHDEFSIKWIANEGIRVSRIVETLRNEQPDNALLKPIFDAKPSYTALQFDARAKANGAEPNKPPTISPISERIPAMPTSSAEKRIVNVTLAIDGDGSVSVVGSAGLPESTLFEATSGSRKEVDFDVPFDATYTDRKGFDTKFLSPKPEHITHLPELSDALVAVATPLLKPTDGNKNVLHYHNYSVVMHGERRFAIYTAANLDFGDRWDMSRPKDIWRTDPRIRADAQIGDFYYRSNKFDRGHLTRREDLEFGSTFKKALVSAADTCHWTNCTPQHAKFNQSKVLWQGVERHILEQSIEAEGFRAQVFTGPILDEDDPVYDKFPKIQYPVRYWKVVAAVNAAGTLFATAYLLDQSDVIAEYGIEAAPETPFSPYKTFQVTIAEVERLTGLSFKTGTKKQVPLSAYDPLVAKKPKQHWQRTRALESTQDLAPAGYLPLDRLDSIILG